MSRSVLIRQTCTQNHREITMQRKLVTFVLTALASGAVFAQSSVQVYGVVDVGFSHRGDNVNSRVSSQNAIDSGLSSGTRIGFKGTEDLGSGLKVLWTLEAGFAADTGEHKQNDRLFGRQAFVGLSGDFGTALVGRQDMPFHSLISDFDPFHSGTVGRYRNTFVAGTSTGGENLFDPYRLDNAVIYSTPVFSGFNVAVAYSNNAIGQEAVDNMGDYRVINIVPRYTHGSLSLGVSYYRIKSEDGDNVNIHNWMLGGAYDFGVLKLSAFYDENKWNDALNVANNDLKLKDWMLGLTVPFGKHAIQAAYNQSKLAWHGDSGKAQQWSLGYTYALSRRTNFYAAIADLHNDKSRKSPGLFGTRAASLSDADNPGNGYQSGFQFGVKQVF
jgi:predicted porin